MASIYCPDCNRQAGDNWTECYFCGGKNLKEGEPSPVTSIPKTETTDDVEVSIERVRQLLNKSKFGKVELTKSEKDELSIGFIHYDELSAVEKVKIDREMDEEAIVDELKPLGKRWAIVLAIVVLIIGVKWWSSYIGAWGEPYDGGRNYWVDLFLLCFVTIPAVFFVYSTLFSSLINYLRPEYATKQRLASLFLTIILIAVISIIAYFTIKFEIGYFADDTRYTCEELMSDIRQEYPDTPILYSEFDIPYDISWEQVVSITNIKQTKLEGDNDISCRGNVILKNSPFNETEGEIYFFKDRKRWYYEIKPLE
jgi:hypothetical protein